MQSPFRRFTTIFFIIAISTALHAADYSVRSLTLPGAVPTGIGMDYIGFDASTDSVWAPAGNTGAVDVIDVKSGTIRQISGFATKEITVRDRKRILGPSSVTIGDGTVYVGNRGDNTVCAFHPKTLARGSCATLDSMPDLVFAVRRIAIGWTRCPTASLT